MTFSFRVHARSLGLALTRSAAGAGELAWLIVAGALGLAASGVGAVDLVVMQVAPYSSEASSLAREYGEGARLYFQQVNARGGIGGSKISLVVRDERNDPELTRKLASAAANERPVAFIGAIGKQSVEALIPTLARLEVPFLGPIVDAVRVDETRNPFVFHTRPTIAQEASAVIEQLHALGIRRMAVCHQDNAIGREGVVGALAEFAKLKAQPVAAVAYGDDPATVEAAATRVAAANAQAVLFIGDTGPAARFLTVLRAKGSYAMMVAGSTVDPNVMVRMVPRDAAIWLAVAQLGPDLRGHHRQEAVVREYLALHTGYGASATPASSIGLEGFITAKILATAIVRAGPNARSADVLRSLAQLRDHDIGGMRVGFADHKQSGLNYTRIGMITPVGSPFK